MNPIRRKNAKKSYGILYYLKKKQFVLFNLKKIQVKRIWDLSKNNMKKARKMTKNEKNFRKLFLFFRSILAEKVGKLALKFKSVDI